MLFKTVEQIDMDLAKRVKTLRRQKGFTQKQFAQKCSMSYGTYKLFEQTGKISLLGLTQIAAGLGREDEIDDLFMGREYSSIDEVIKEYEESGKA